MIVIIVILLAAAYFSINAQLRQRALSRVEEGADTVIEEVMSKLARDSRILNAAAEIISQADNFDSGRPDGDQDHPVLSVGPA